MLGELLRAASFRCQVFFRGQVCNDFSIDTSGTGRINFHLVGSGHCWMHVESSPEPQRLETGDVVILPLDSRHALSPSSTRQPVFGERRADRVTRIDPAAEGMALVCGYIDIGPPVQDLVIATLPEWLVVGARSTGGAQVKRLVEALLEEAHADGPAAHAVVERIADALLLKVLEIAIARLEKPSGLVAALLDARLGRAFAAAIREPARDWSVDSLAEQAFMSRSAFASRFAELVGRGPMEVLGEWRMQLAWRLLRQEHVSVATAGERVGYRAEAAFRKAFKRHFGVGPGELRRR